MTAATREIDFFIFASLFVSVACSAGHRLKRVGDPVKVVPLLIQVASVFYFNTTRNFE
jgi:hypothetical protein